MAYNKPFRGKILAATFLCPQELSLTIRENTMKPFARLLFGLVLAAALFVAGCASRPVAKVDGTPISQESFYKGLEHGTGLSEEFQAGRAVLDTMIGITLIEKEAAKQNITVSPEELKQGLEEYKKSIQASTNLSLEDFLKKTGATQADVEARVKLSILLQRLIVSDLEIEEYFKAHTKDLNKPERVTFLEVLFPDQADAAGFRKQVQDKKQDIIATAQAWEKTGKHIAPPPEGVQRTVPVDRLAELGTTLKEALLALQPGEISQPKEIEIIVPVNSQQGSARKIKVWALASLVSHEPEVIATLDNSREKIRQQLYQQKSYSGQVANYANSLKSRARIEIINPAYASLADDYKELAKTMPKPNLPAHEHEQGQEPGAATGTEAAPH
jgi:hypothetical protein